MASMPKSMVKISLQERFVSLLDSLSAVRKLVQVNLEQVSEKGLLQLALQSLIEHYDLAFCSIFLLEDGLLHCAVGSGLEEQVGTLRLESEQWAAGSMEFALGEGIIGIACETGQIQYCRNCATDERFKPFRGKSIFHGSGSVVSVPITVSGKMLGVLNVSHHQPDFFETWQQHMLILYCNILGHTLNNHRLVRTLEEALRHHAPGQVYGVMEEARILRAPPQQASNMDELTKLPNRRSFFDRGVSLLERNFRAQDPFGLLLVDITDFRGINDRWGHAVGDRVLMKIARALRDEACNGDMVARLGGDEFVILLCETRPPEVDGFVTSLQHRLEALDIEGVVGKLGLTVRTGISWLNGLDREPVGRALERLYSEAAEDLVSRKQTGSNQTRLYDADSSLSG
jgi:diguanylate cyclase (GGDEF)-like protein